MGQPVLELKNISKNYGAHQVLKGVSFSVMPGEVRGIIGENGAGKSTLMNIIFGMPVIQSTGGYGGEICVDGKVVNMSHPKQAMRHGIGMVHQEFMLIPELSVFENIKLGREETQSTKLQRALPQKLRLLDIEQMRQDSQTALKKVGLTLDEWMPVAGLPVGHMQFIEIAREIDRQNVRFLVFDEPTAVLTESEAAQLLKTVKHLAKDLDIAALFISHRLHEIEEICDSITVLRDGEQVGDFHRGDIAAPQMAELMVGRKVKIELKQSSQQEDQKTKEPTLSLKGFCASMPAEKVHDIDLDIYPGEVLGVGGLAGQGKLALGNGLAAMCPTKGDVFKNGKKMSLSSSLEVIQSGVAFLSEDRRGVGLNLGDSIAHNMVVTANYVQKKFVHPGVAKIFGLLDKQAIHEHVERMIQKLDVRCRSQKQAVGSLSGGNQQKVCFARVLTLSPDVLIVAEPTRGVDIGAKKIILDQILELSEQGVAVVVISSELMELRSVSDRIVIVAEGKVSGEFAPDACDRDIGLAMSV